jgi:hypothetical protein
MVLAEEMNENAGVTTSSPGPVPSAVRASVSAPVPLAQPIACVVPTCAAIAASSSAARDLRMNSSDWPTSRTTSTRSSTQPA